MCNSTSRSEPGWIAKARDHVRVKGYVAALDEAQAQAAGLTASDLNAVRQAIQQYNQLPLPTRAVAPHSLLYTFPASGPALLAPAAAGGPYQITLAGVNWCCVTLWINGRLANDLGLGLIGEGLLAGLLATLFGSSVVLAPFIPLVAVIAVYLGAEGATLQTLNSDCNGQGAYFNFLITNPAIFWPSIVC